MLRVTKRKIFRWRMPYTVYQEPMTHRLLLIPYALQTSIVNRDKYTTLGTLYAKMLATPLTIALYWAIGVNRHYPLWLSRLVIPSTKYRVHSSLRITNSRLSKWYVNIHGGCRTRCERCCPSSGSSVGSGSDSGSDDCSCGRSGSCCSSWSVPGSSSVTSLVKGTLWLFSMVSECCDPVGSWSLDSTASKVACRP